MDTHKCELILVPSSLKATKISSCGARDTHSSSDVPWEDRNWMFTSLFQDDPLPKVVGIGVHIGGSEACSDACIEILRKEFHFGDGDTERRWKGNGRAKMVRSEKGWGERV